MNVGFLLRISFFIIFFTAGFWMLITQMNYYKALRGMNNNPYTSFSDMFFGKRITSDEVSNFYSDLFSRDIKNDKTKIAIQRVRISYAISLIVLIVGVVIFNLY